jgi:hypothetical protein
MHLTGLLQSNTEASGDGAGDGGLHRITTRQAAIAGLFQRVAGFALALLAALGSSMSTSAEDRPALNRDALVVLIDGKPVWEGKLGPAALAADGPVRIRADNARLKLQLFAPPDAADACPKHGDAEEGNSRSRGEPRSIPAMERVKQAFA